MLDELSLEADATSHPPGCPRSPLWFARREHPDYGATESIGGPPGEHTTIAILGGGASCVMILAHLAKSGEAGAGTKICVFEPRYELGRGTAYQRHSDVLLLNTPPEAMGVTCDDPGEFARLIGDEFPSSRNIPRRAYGHYLASKADEAIRSLKIQGVIVEHIRKKVINLEVGVENIVWTEDERYIFNACVLATGAAFHNPVPALLASSRYIASSVDFEEIASLPHGAEIGVIGSGQSALDVAVLRGTVSPRDHLTLFSRSGVLPRVRHNSARDLETPLLSECPDLDRILAKLSSEIRWASKSICDGKITGSLRSFVVDTKRASRRKPSWQKVMERITPEINDVWARLDENQRQQFVSECFPIMYYLRSAVSVETAERVRAMFCKRRLDVLRGEYKLIERGEKIIYRNRCIERDFDFVVNATGLTPIGALDYLSEKSAARVRRTKEGGLMVDLESMRLMTAANDECLNVFALGFPTKGSTLVVNSIELVRPHAKKIAMQLLQTISIRKQVSCS